MDENQKDKDLNTNEQPAGEPVPEEQSADTGRETPVQDGQEEKPKFVLNLDEDALDAPPEEPVKPKKTAGKKKKKKKSVGWLIAFSGIIVGVSILLAGLILMTFSDIMALNKPDKDIQVVVERNSSTKEIAELLEKNGVINHAWLFRFVAHMGGEDSKFQYGIFNLNSKMPYEEIISELQQNVEKPDTVKITIKEGETLQDAAKALQDAKICSSEDFISTINKQTFGLTFEQHVSNSAKKFHRIEGFVFPDTYEFYKGQSPELVAKTILTNFDKKITSDLWGRMEELDMTLEETITRASIIQAEAGDPAQMKKVAGVFYNRLDNPDKFPKLESDPTRKYVEDYIKPYDKLDNQEMYKAYNTYEGAGLPPGAICNPGLDAIKAALYPEDNDYFYFCSNLDTREFFYAKTLQQHNKNLRKAGLR